MVQTMHQAHDEIKENIDRKNFILAQDIVRQCQECAISIGTAIEKLEGEGFITVPFIETYCDILFTIYEELNGSDANANKIYKNLKKQLLRIENSIKNDIPIRKEIAFFPYKASMWDSLESVYLAAKQDPDCDAYCVPIPYYDRNADGSLGKMHYEGREYPSDIEAIDWQTYNFEERKPDAIYIHNPYDDWNLVTCVHPRFFSANLKKYTDELVYIPYFVTDEIEPDDQKRIDGIKHFIWTPGVINADKVIVQSEKMKKIYVNEYLKAAQANRLQGKHTDRKYLEEKIQGLGSPKLEKVKNTKKEDLEIPQDWLEIIKKPDGRWKKIVFYNTSIAALLENNEKMLEKMKDVFRLFKENQDEIALLWRPHPLIKSTVSSMRPQLWTEYEKIVNQYKQENWGIYDDSSDVDRAIIISDAYYGDGSSVVQMYQQTGKPVMIQNAMQASETQVMTVLTKGALINKDECWFPSMEVNGLFYGKMENGETVSLKKVCEFEELEADNHIRKVIDTKDAIYFFSEIASDMWKWDKNEKIMVKKNYSGKRKMRIANVEKIENNIWIMPCKFDMPVICYDYENEISKEIDWSSNIYESADANTITRTVVHQNCIYFCTRVPDRILLYKIDCESRKIDCFPIEDIRYVNCLTVYENGVWILGTNKNAQTIIAKVDICNIDKAKKSNVLKRIKLENDQRLTYFKMIPFGKELFLLPASGEKICVLNMENMKEEILEYPREIENKKNLFYETQQKEQVLYLFPYNSKFLLLFDMNTHNFTKVQVIAQKEDYIHMKQEKMMTEKENIRLNFLLDKIKKGTNA